MKILFLVILLIFFVGCSTTLGLDPVIGHSGFDNAKTVNIVPHSNRCGWDMVCTGLGVQWNGSDPEVAILLVQIFNEYMGILGAKLNIDGKTIKLLPTIGTTHLLNDGTASMPIKTSRKGFVVTMDTVHKILSAKRVWLRVRTTKGTMENAVIDDDGDSKAYHALKRFMRSVRS